MDETLSILAVLPANIQKKIEDTDSLLEVIIDLDRPIELRYLNYKYRMEYRHATQEDIDYVVGHLSSFGKDNRAGINRTLHRVSRIVTRTGETVGLTLRVGRPFLGNIGLIQDLLETGENILIVGRPGSGKSTLLRGCSFYLSVAEDKNVVIVDSSNEIAGDGNVPHACVGYSRRLQVPIEKDQHEVMIEAVENHLPEVIVIDEVSTSEEAEACATIAQRGVQLIATAHGKNLMDVLKNPAIKVLLGNVKSVTLGDEEAEKRGTSKTVQEREKDPVFTIAVELIDYNTVKIHRDIDKVVDSFLMQGEPTPEERRCVDGKVITVERANIPQPGMSIRDRINNNQKEVNFRKKEMRDPRKDTAKRTRKSRY